MYIPAHFALTDTDDIHAFIRANNFAMVVAHLSGEIHFAYVPVVLDSNPRPLGSVYFHVARANPMAMLEEGAALKCSFIGAHTYVSPDWYEADGLVPTWNYLAAEGTGRVRRLDEAETRAHIDALAAQEETALSPKPAWSAARLPPGRAEQLLRGICGFQLPFDGLEGKFKLSQNRSESDIRGVISALEQGGSANGKAVAGSMRKFALRQG